MIAETERLADSVSSVTDQIDRLHAAIDALPEMKDIEIAISGNALETVEALSAELDSLDGKTVVVSLVYKTVNSPDEDINAATEIIRTVNVPSEGAPATADTGGVAEGFQDIANAENEASDAAQLFQEAVNSGTAQAIRDLDDTSAAMNAVREAAQDMSTADIADAAASFSSLGEAEKGVSASASLAESASALLQDEIERGAISATDAAAAMAQLAYAAQSHSKAASSDADSTGTFNHVLNTGIALFAAGSGWLGRWNAHFQLFGGLLRAVGIPGFIASASALHILADAVIEVAGTLIPAAAAFGAFGVAAAGDVVDIYHQMENLFQVTSAFGENIYPFTGALQAMQNAVKPEVYVLFGEALEVMTRNTGAFTELATSAGQVLDMLGARLEVALTSGDGFSVFLKNATADLAGWGDLIGNIFGIIGDVLKELPGYAQLFLQLADDISHGIEWMTSSGFGEWLIGIGLALHGFILWAGLGVTAIVQLGDFLIGLGAKVGLVSAEFTLFNAAEFGTALKLAASYTWDLIGALVTLDGAEAVTEAATGALEAVMMTLAAVNPLVWVGIAVGALTALILAFGRGQAAADAFTTSIQDQVSQAPDLTSSYTDAISGLEALRSNYAYAEGNLDAVTKTIQNLSDNQGQLAYSSKTLSGATGDFGDAAADAGAKLSMLQQQQASWADQASSDSNEIKVLTTYTGNYNELLKAAGGNTAFLSQANITQQDIFSAGKSQMSEYIAELQGMVDAQNALSLGAGRAAAALNAEGIAAGTSPGFGEMEASLKTITGDEQTLMSVITGSETAFDTFALGQSTLASNFSTAAAATKTATNDLGGLTSTASLAGAAIGGTSTASLNLAQAFYTQISNAQNLIGALQNQSISTKDLTQVVATAAGEMLQYAGNNTAAQTVVEALINNALGPGTVSLQSMNKWVGQNSVSLNTMNGIIAASTIQVSGLAGVVTSDLNSAIASAIIEADGGTKSFGILKTALDDTGGALTGQVIPDAINAGNVILNTLGGNVSATKTEFEKMTTAMGLNAKQAQTLWDEVFPHLSTALKDSTSQADNLAKALGSLPKTLSITLRESGFGNFTVSGLTQELEQVANPSASTIRTALSAGEAKARGGVIPGYDPGHDTVPALLSPGEGVLVPQAVRALGGERAINAINAHARHFAQGGYVPAYSGDIQGLGSWTQQDYVASEYALTAALEGDMDTVLHAAASAYQKAQAAATAAAGSGLSNVLALARYLMAHGATAAAAAGIAGDVYGESGGNAEAVEAGGGGGWGLIQWTGNTLGLPAGYTGPTGNPTKDLDIQIAGVLGYINANGGLSAINAAGGFDEAADIFSADYLRPAVLYSDTRPSVAQEVYSMLTAGSSSAIAHGARTQDAGGWIYPGLNLVENKTGKLERTVPPGEPPGESHVHLHLNGKEIAHEILPDVRAEGYRYASRNNGNASYKGNWAPR